MTEGTSAARRRVLVTFSTSPALRKVLTEILGGTATIDYLHEAPDGEREQLLASADALLSGGLNAELRGPDELRLIDSAGLVQFLSAGVDHVPFDRLPQHLAVATNAGAYARPMAEHVLAMALALAKRLPQNHRAMMHGEFDQKTPSRDIRGSTVGILGFGGIGQETARLFIAFGARIRAINRSGRTTEPVDWMGTLTDLDDLLARADILVVSIPLTRATRGLIASRELSLMKPDAILVNVARADIIDEDDLYAHLQQNAAFSAAIDVWWQEPGPHGSFATRHPFLELPNVLGSPHNSGNTAGTLAAAARRAAENVARFLHGEPVQHLIDRSDYIG